MTRRPAWTRAGGQGLAATATFGSSVHPSRPRPEGGGRARSRLLSPLLVCSGAPSTRMAVSTNVVKTMGKDERERAGGRGRTDGRTDERVSGRGRPSMPRSPSGEEDRFHIC